MPKLYTRNQGGIDRYYADLRDIGGGQRALKTPGSNRATSSETEALKLLAQQIEELEGSQSQDTALLGPFTRISSNNAAFSFDRSEGSRLSHA